MAFSPGYKARVLLGDFSLSAKLTDAGVPLTVDMHDVTTFGDNGVKAFIPGQSSSTFSLSGFTDAETHADQVAWTTATPFTYGPTGLAVGAPVFMSEALQATYEPGTQVGSAASFTVSGQTTGLTTLGSSLMEETATDAEITGTTVDNGAASSAGGVAHLHITAWSGLTNATFVVSHSTDAVTWPVLVNFGILTGTTSARVKFGGTVHRYIRARVHTLTGTGSYTAQMSFLRN